jgi:hypothetical protein
MSSEEAPGHPATAFEPALAPRPRLPRSGG